MALICFYFGGNIIILPSSAKAPNQLGWVSFITNLHNHFWILKMGWLSKFDNHPQFQNFDFEKGKLFLVLSAAQKLPGSQKINLLMSNFCFFSFKMIQRGNHWIIFAMSQPKPQLQLSWVEITLISAKTSTTNPPTNPTTHQPRKVVSEYSWA